MRDCEALSEKLEEKLRSDPLALNRQEHYLSTALTYREIKALRVDVKEGFKDLRTEFREGFKELRGEFRTGFKTLIDEIKGLEATLQVLRA